MARTLTLTLSASYIKQAVKSDTYITGQIDKSADMVKNAALAFNEQAGDENYHNLKLFRTMKGALAKFEAQVAEYVETSSNSAQITDTLASDATDSFTITITVGDRTSGAFTNTLAYLAQEYIINMMLYYWWQPIKPSLAKDYLGFSSDNILDVKRCLSKSAPTSSSSSYDDIHGSVTIPPVTLTYRDVDHYTIEGGTGQEDIDEDGYLIRVTDITNNLYTNSVVNVNVGSTSQVVKFYEVSADKTSYIDSGDQVSSPGNINAHGINTIEHMDSSGWVLFIPASASGLNSLTITITTP